MELREKLRNAPVAARVVPFAVFLLLTACQGKFGEQSRYWFYLIKTLVGASLVWMVWPFVREMRWKVSWEGIAVGLAVFLMWVGLDPFYPKLGSPGPGWNPEDQFGMGTFLAWLFIVVRIAGSTLVVPPLEEVFYRSFLYRYIASADFEKVRLGEVRWMPILVTSVIFGITHHQWLAGILCGLAYQGLVCWRKRLGDAMVAHAVTNLALGIWVVVRGEWHFW